MTNHETERESWWVRLGRAMCPGLYAISILAPGQQLRAACLGIDQARRRRGPSEGGTR